jgi:hypothetical protein
VRNLAAAWQRLHEIQAEGRELNDSQKATLRKAEAVLGAAGMLGPEQPMGLRVRGGNDREPVRHSHSHGFSLRSINPLKGTANCGACAIALDHTLGGSPSVAINKEFMYITEIASIMRRVWQPLNQAGVERRLLAAGDGARGIVLSRFRTKNGWGLHAFNSINQGGKIQFLDGQIGTPADLSKHEIISFLPTSP